MMQRSKSAMVLFSGGQDSTTRLAWALNQFERVETIGFDYGQRHLVELQCRETIRNEIRRHFPEWGKRLGEDHTLDLDVLGQLSDTALTRDAEIAMTEEGLPNTFVPGRNIIFLSFAAALSYRRSITHLVTGVCETDYSGYPDCRDDTIKALQVALNLGMETRTILHTPLMWIDKSQTWELAFAFGGETLVDLIIEHTHTCYHGDRSKRSAWGYGCGTCPACELRAGGYEQYVRRRNATREQING